MNPIQRMQEAKEIIAGYMTDRDHEHVKTLKQAYEDELEFLGTMNFYDLEVDDMNKRIAQLKDAIKMAEEVLGVLKCP